MRWRLPSGIAVAIAIAISMATFFGTAFAYFTTTGSGSTAVEVSTISPPSITAATPAVVGTVTLAWTAVTAPGTGAVTYSVSRDGGKPSGDCPTGQAGILTCTDSGLELGTHSYVVTAKWRSWSAVSTVKTATITVGPADHFVLTAASTTPAAAASDNLTITAKDAGNHTITTYAGSHNLTFTGAATSPSGAKPTVANSSGTATNFGSATAIGFTAGVATVSSTKNGVMTLYASGEADIEVSDGSISTEAPLEVTVSPLAASKLVLGAATTTPAAGATDNLTTTAQDTYGNTATSYTGSHSLTYTGASASPDGTVPTVSNSSGADVAFGTAIPIAFTAGVASASGGKNGAMKLYRSGSTSVKVSDGTLSVTLVVTVAPGEASKLVLTAATTTPAAAASDNLTTTAQDAYGNTATSYTGSHNLIFSGAATSVSGAKPTVSNSSGTATNFGTATAIGFTAGVATVSSTKNGVMKIYASGEADVEVSDGSISTAAPLEVTVSFLAASKLVLAAATTTPVAGEADNLTTTAQDTYGNTVTSYAGSHSLTFTGASASPDGTVPTVSNSSGADVAFGTAIPITFTAGVASAGGGKNGAMKLYKSGSTSVKVSDGTLSVTLVVTVAPEAASEFTLVASSTTPVEGVADNLTITALDTYGNTDTNYAGAHNLTFSGSSASPNATLPTVVDSAGAVVNFGSPTSIAFTAGVAKVASSKNGVMKLYRAGAASIVASDGAISNPTPAAITVSPGTAARWALTNINVSAGSLGSTCLFTCTLTGLGNSGTVTARVAVTDAVGNTVSAVGSGHAAKVTTNGTGTISGTPLTIPTSGAAESATSFTFTSRSSGSFTEILTVAASSGTAYTTATLTASK